MDLTLLLIDTRVARNFIVHQSKLGGTYIPSSGAQAAMARARC